MNIVWKHVYEIEDFVKTTLSEEADDIPQELVIKHSWYTEMVPLERIKVNQQMIENHDKNPIHIKRRDGFIATIKNNGELLPLIVLGGDLFLVDGYARYRALKYLGIEQVKVFRQLVN